MKRAHPVRAFRRAWQRQAAKLPAFGRVGRWALQFAQERPRLAEAPLFGTALEELTGAEVSKREAPQRAVRRVGSAMEPPSAPAPSASGGSASRRILRREAPREPAPPRALPAEAPGVDIARWAGERAAFAATEPAKRRVRPAPAERPNAPGPQSLANHRREIAARSRRPLSVAGMPREFPGKEESTEAGEHPTRGALPEASGSLAANAISGPDGPSHAHSGAVPDVALGEPAPRTPRSSLLGPGGSGNDPWGTLVSGVQVPSTVLEGTATGSAPTSRPLGKRAAELSPRGRTTLPLSAVGEESPAGSSAPDLPRSSRDRSDAPAFDAQHGHPLPFAPIAGDPLSPHLAASPLGPFPGAPASARALPEAAPAASTFPPEAFSAVFSPSSGSADELSELAAKIERILADEARRHGIDV